MTIIIICLFPCQCGRVVVWRWMRRVYWLGSTVPLGRVLCSYFKLLFSVCQVSLCMCFWGFVWVCEVARSATKHTEILKLIWISFFFIFSKYCWKIIFCYFTNEAAPANPLFPSARPWLVRGRAAGFRQRGLRLQEPSIHYSQQRRLGHHAARWALIGGEGCPILRLLIYSKQVG